MVWKLTQWFVHFVGRGRLRFQGLMDVYDEMIAADTDLIPSPDVDPRGKEHTVFVSYANLVARHQAPPLRFPADIRSNYKRKFHKAWHASGREETPKLCCLYLRYENPFSKVTRLRNGGELFSALPAIRILNAVGYQVALTGDRNITPEMRREFRGKLIDDVTIDGDRNTYQLYAASEADIFIGNNGGGLVVSTINKIPCLFLDWFPVVYGFKRAWFYFKSATYKDGTPVSYDRLLGEHAFDFTCSFGMVNNNTEEEIVEALESFLQDLNNMDAPDPYADVAALIPQDSVFRYSGSRISPAWVRRNVPEQGAAPGAGKPI